MNQLSISDQYPHAKNLSSKFGGRESSNRYNGHNTFTNLQCPCCSRKKAVMYVAENQSTYLLKCPRDSCQLSTAITLSNAINTYATEFMSAWNVLLGNIRRGVEFRIADPEGNHRRINPMVVSEQRWKRMLSDKRWRCWCRSTTKTMKNFAPLGTLRLDKTIKTAVF